MTGTISFILACIVGTSFISGVMSLGGGTILMGIMGWVLPVSVAMMLHGVTQIASNGTRGLIYWRHIYWPVLLKYFIGAAICVSIFAWIAYVPDKIVLFLLLGIMPFGNYLTPKKYALDITRGGTAYLCGFLVSACLLTAGVSGPILDVFYNKSTLNRYQIHATKGVTQSIGHLIKVIYFAFILNLMDDALAVLPLWVFAAVIPLAYLGVYLARRVVQAMSDDQFRSWTQYITMAIGTVFLIKALNLIINGG